MATTISDWTDDYGAGDMNLPQGSDPIPDPVDGDYDVGAVLRDSKAVTRGETLNRQWEPDALGSITGLTSTTFKKTGDYRTTYPLGTAVKIQHADLSIVYSWIVGVSYAAGETTWTVASAVITGAILYVTFSSLLPGSSFARESATYGRDVGGPFPRRVTQRGEFQITDPATTVTAVFLYEEPDTDYLPMVQAISQAGGAAPNGAFRITNITRTTTGFSMTLDAAPNPATSMIWEYLIVRTT